MGFSLKKRCRRSGRVRRRRRATRYETDRQQATVEPCLWHAPFCAFWLWLLAFRVPFSCSRTADLYARVWSCRDAECSTRGTTTPDVGGGCTHDRGPGIQRRRPHERAGFWPHLQVAAWLSRCLSLSLARHLGERMASLVPVQNAW